MNNESNQYIRELFLKWAAEYGVDSSSHEEWNKFLSIWNFCLDSKYFYAEYLLGGE